MAGCLLLLAGAAGCGAPPARVHVPVLLTTDCGCEVDDQWALAHLVLASEEGDVDLLGVVTTHAKNLRAPAAETSAAEVREVLRVLRPLEPPPVIAGSSLPLESSERARDGLGARFIVELSRGFGPARRLRVLVIGAATDVASALLLEPAMANRIELVAMAFEGWPAGGDSWNAKGDPAAWRVLLGSKAPLVIAPADACKKHLVLDAGAARSRLGGAGAPGDFLIAKLEGWLAREEKLCREITGRSAWPIWDLSTVAYILGWTTMDLVPRPRLRDDLSFDLDGASGTLGWITRIDEKRLFGDLRERLERWTSRMTR